jgi:hypothetical protein
MVDITEPNNAQLAAKAEILNEVCDLDGVEVQLVTGYPNLQFADVVSPIAMKENLAQFMQSLIRGQSERGMIAGAAGNIVTQRMAYDRSGGEGFGLPMPAYGAAEVGKTAEDLFLYPVRDVRLERGEVGYFPLFTEAAPYSHIYIWEIPDYTEAEGSGYDSRRQQGPAAEPEQEVWHCIRLENATNVPWTTAPVEIVKEGIIVGQDTLNYTPVKGKGTVRITRAMGVKAEQLELETGRERNVAQWYGYQYDLVKVHGKLSITNMEDKAIEVEIAKRLSGEMKTMQPEAKVEKLAKALRAVNANVKLTWMIDLAGTEQKQIEYTYEVYVRR